MDGQEQEQEQEQGMELEQGETLGQEPEETTDPETGTAEESEQEEQPEVEKPTLTQKEFEAELGKRLARERRKFEREMAALADPAPLKIESKLDPATFATTEEYLDALADERAEAKIAHRDHSRSVNEIEQKYQDQVDAAEDKYPDYIQVAHTHKFMTADMASAIKSSDLATDMAYYLGSNLKEAERIFKLPPMLQIKELGKLEARLEAGEPAVKKTSSAPPPIKPLAGAKASVPAYDTTDPRSSKTMSATEWITKDRARRAKALAAKGYK
jgi:hypothetical protein